MGAITCKRFRVRHLLMLFVVCVAFGAARVAVCSDNSNHQEAKLIGDRAGQLAEAWDDSSVSKAIDLYRDAARRWNDANNYVESAECLRRLGTLLLSDNKGSDAEMIQLCTWWDVLAEARLQAKFDADTLAEVERYLRGPAEWLPKG